MQTTEYDDGDDSPPIDFSELLVIVKQFTKVNNPIPALTKISRKLLEVAERCYDDSSGIEEVLETITKVVLASQCRELEIILFACELRMMNDYGFADGAVGSILEHPWPIDTLSTVADKLIEQHGTKPDYFPLQLILKLLDRVNRQDDATDYLRSVAEQKGEYHSFLHRLIEFNHLGEAEQLCLKQIKKDMLSGRFNVNRNNYVSCLQEIAEKRNDWNTIASIQVSEFSDYQSLPKIKELLATAQRLKCVNAARSKIERVLLAKELPEAIAEMFNSQRTGKEQSADRTKLELVLQKPAKEQKKRFDLLCDWAIAERRVDDAIKWFDEFSKAKSTGQYIDLKKLADAVLEKYPARAAVFYRQVAEQRIENAKDYYGAVDCLKRMKTALEKDHRLADWDNVIAEIRTVHNRKRNLLQLLDELQGKSIVREKQQKM